MYLLKGILILFSVVSTMGAPIKGFLNNNKLPNTGQDWISVAPGAEVQPADFSAHPPETAARMQNTLNRMLSGERGQYEYSTLFLDGGETYYDDYAQAWRLLGFYIDCNANYNNEDDEDDEGSGCKRYLMWAAYIDPHYAGGGIGEYQFYDRRKKSWSSASCTAADGRCAKMDCHLPSTEFKLLAIYKEPNYDDWMEQLFKHLGVCIWSDTEYEFMQNDRELWPNGCTAIVDQNGNNLYYDVKPLPGGRMTVGIYSDQYCIEEYNNSKDALAILQYARDNNENEDEEDNNSGEDDEWGYGLDIADLEEYIGTWNSAFDIFKICQPCRAYDLGWNEDLQNGQTRNGGNEEDQDDENGGYFTCKDDADYTNVNQCMKFSTHTEMVVALDSDVALAADQGTIMEIDLNGYRYGDNGFLAEHYALGGVGLKPFFFSSLALFAIGCVMFVWAMRKKGSSNMQEPLIESEGVAA